VTLSTYRRYTNNCIYLSIYLSIYCASQRHVHTYEQYYTVEHTQYGDSTGNTIEENSGIFFPNLNVLVTISKDMPAVKLSSNKILQFLTANAS